MTYKTHLLGGIIAGAIVGINPVGVAVAGVASLLPDIDTPHSKLGGKIKPISRVLNMTLGHRGVLHSLLGTAIFYILAMLIIPEYSLYFLVGYLSHILLDALTIQGVPLLYPTPKKLRLPLFNTGSLAEGMLTTLMFVVAILLFAKGMV